jgi:transcriptional regulator with GAF, ATPase, and Fis domain
MAESFLDDQLTTLVEAVHAVVSATIVAVARPAASSGRVELAYALGAEVGQLTGSADDIPGWLQRLCSDSASCLSFNGRDDVILWIAGPDLEPLTADQRRQLAALAGTVLADAETAEARSARLLRLDEVTRQGLLPTLPFSVEGLVDSLTTALTRYVQFDSIFVGLVDAGDLLTWHSDRADAAAVSSGSLECSPDFIHNGSFRSIKGATAVLYVPVRAGGRTLALMAVVSAAPKRFSLTDLSLVARLAEQAAGAIAEERLAEADRRARAHEERTAKLDALLGTLASARDVRDVFDRISEIGNAVLPHDAMTIVVGGENPGTARIYAATGAMSHLPVQREVPLPNVGLLTGSADYELIDDLAANERYRTVPAFKAGMRSMLVMLNRVAGRVHSAVNFLSATPGRFTADDVPIARRIADHIGLAVSQRRVADEARQVQILQSRTASIQLLDELLKTLSDGGELAHVIDRISDASRKALPHDALLLAVILPDGGHVRPYVSSGIDAKTIPQVVELPASMRGDDWDYQVVDDLSVDATNGMQAMLRLGFKSALRLAVRLEGRIVGALVFLKSELNGFKHDDVIVSRRVADRVALSLARERGVEATRRADEASERAARLEARVRALTDELDARSGFRRVIGESVSWRTVLTQTTQVAATDTTVLLLGESGTGKEVVARLLHRGSRRRQGPFIALNCAALPEQLLEAELFGYERGAFTGATQSKPGQLEQASGGVLFLDEVGEMSLPAQAKFLRVLQEREFQRLGGTRILRTDARIVAATNRDLHKATTTGQFREDLFYRLNVFAIRLPPLRERRDDILPLTQAFLAEFGRAFANPPAGISREAKEGLLRYHWPGNVRELRNILERAAILCDGGLITDEHLGLPLTMGEIPRSISPPVRVTPDVATPVPAPSPPAAFEHQPGSDLQSVERMMIEKALQQARFNKSKAAKELGLSRHQLYIRMRRHGLAD